MAKVYMEDMDNAKIVRAEGTLSIQDASGLRECLLEALSSSETLLIDLSGVQSIDLACLQIFCSAHKTYSQAQKVIRITGDLPEGVVRSLSSITIVPEACDKEPHGPCLWATGGRDE
jgi:anti-anti-sigma regulatory factor